MKILIIEDDPQLNDQLASALRHENHTVDQAFDGEQGELLGSDEVYDAIVLDLGLPILDGLSVLKSWRDNPDDIPAKNTPVLILTARQDWSDALRAFESGADDYVRKPYHVEEVLARLGAIVRRKAGFSSPVLRWGPLALNTGSGRVTINGNPVSLTAYETKLFSYMMHNQDRILSRAEISEHVYEADNDKDSNTIDVFIGRLRKKLPDTIIETVRGGTLGGYRINPRENTDE